MRKIGHPHFDSILSLAYGDKVSLTDLSAALEWARAAAEREMTPPIIFKEVAPGEYLVGDADAPTRCSGSGPLQTLHYLIERPRNWMPVDHIVGGAATVGSVGQRVKRAAMNLPLPAPAINDLLAKSVSFQQGRGSREGLVMGRYTPPAKLKIITA